MKARSPLIPAEVGTAGLADVTKQVVSMEDDMVVEAIEREMIRVAVSILEGNGDPFSYPEHRCSNHRADSRTLTVSCSVI